MSDEIRERYRKRGISYWEMVNKYLSNKQETGEKANANVVNTVLALSCELLLKSMIDEQEITHELKKLYEKLPDELKSEISISDENLEDINNAFDSRYPGFLKGNTNILYFFASNLADISKRNGEDISPKLDILPSLDVANNVEIYKNWFELGNSFLEMIQNYMEDNNRLDDGASTFLAFSSELFLKSTIIYEWISEGRNNNLDEVLKKSNWEKEYRAGVEIDINDKKEYKEYGYYPICLRDGDDIEKCMTYGYTKEEEIFELLEKKGITFGYDKKTKPNGEDRNMIFMKVNGQKYDFDYYQQEGEKKDCFKEISMIELCRNRRSNNYALYPTSINLELGGCGIIVEIDDNPENNERISIKYRNAEIYSDAEYLYSNYNYSEWFGSKHIPENVEKTTLAMSHELYGLFNALSPFSRYLLIGTYLNNRQDEKITQSDFARIDGFEEATGEKPYWNYYSDYDKSAGSNSIVKSDEFTGKTRTSSTTEKVDLKSVSNVFVDSRYLEIENVDSTNLFLVDLVKSAKKVSDYVITNGITLPDEYESGNYRSSVK